jgi:hypothetical protein
MPSYFFTIALGIELLEVSPNILGLLFILDSGKYHFGAWNSRSRIFDVFLKRLFVPCDAGILIGIGVAVIRRTSRVAAVEAVEFGSDTVRRARPGLVTRRALLKTISRPSRRPEPGLVKLIRRKRGRRKKRFHHYFSPLQFGAGWFTEWRFGVECLSGFI